MANNAFYGVTASYRLKLSSITFIVFLVVAGVCFYLNLTGLLSDIVYYAILIGLIVAALVLTYLFGRISKKHDSTMH
ncbi:MAG: hypothetical protein ACFCUE_01800 [Candidatus Bathyarchaeia archaeon]|jgi:O-antigen/teichoic acid export membrane protein